MPSVYQLKSAFQDFLRPCVRRLVVWGISANQVTVIACVVSLALGTWLMLQPQNWVAWLCLPVWLFLRMALNAIDGMMAREHDMKSPLGAILNEAGDIIADVALSIPFVFVLGLNSLIVILFIIAAVGTEFIGVLGIQIGASRRYDGPMGKSDRAVLIGCLGLANACNWINVEYVNYIFAIMFLMCVVCMFNRARQALIEIKAKTDV